MIYTSYYGNRRNFPHNYIPIQISNTAPFNIRFKIDKVIPDWKTLVSPHKKGIISDEEYKDIYLKYLNKNKDSILKTIRAFDSSQFQGRYPIMLCYCKKGNFCHRNILREWLNDKDIKCEEI